MIWVWYGWTPFSTNEDWKFGIYLSESASMDQFTYTQPEYLAVFSAGNDRTNAPTTQPTTHLVQDPVSGLFVTNTTTVRNSDGDQGGYDTMNSWGSAKNVLPVGAVNDLVGGYTNAAGVTLASFSSFGPTDDGRIKPDVVANGVGVITPASGADNSYFYPAGLDGTSFSSPSVAGSVDLLAERYRQLHPNARRLQAASLKSLVIQTADECGAALGPDYAFGWGLMNTRKAVDLLGQNATNGWKSYVKEVLLQPGNIIEFPVVVVGSTNTLKVTTCWSDPAATPPTPSIDPTNRMLINDLDLRIIGPSVSTNFPWVLNRTSPASAATKADNTVDNGEQVSIPNPTNGTYLVRVTHKGSLLNDLGQTSYQNGTILLSGNIAQPPSLPLITSIAAITTSNTVALKWSSDVGRVYRVQYRDDISSGSWQYGTSELSATKTNTAVVLSVAGITNRFYRIAQVR